jgi:hypothetical protein
MVFLKNREERREYEKGDPSRIQANDYYMCLWYGY